MELLELTVTSCLHMVRYDKDTLKHEAFGSGMMVGYKGRYFICTAAHFTDHPNKSIGIITGEVKDGLSQLYELGDFCYMDRISFEDMPDAEDLESVLEDPRRSGVRLDLAFREVPLLDNIRQPKRVFNLAEEWTLIVEEGGKAILIVDDAYVIEKSELCSFFGRIRPDDRGNVIDYREQIYFGLEILDIQEDSIKMDLGEPVRDFDRFRGCSGAPILDTRGRLVGIVTHGDKDPKKPWIYGFRFDKVKEWIDLLYFNNEVIQEPATPTPS